MDETEIASRRDTALLRALSTPHKKQADMKVRITANYRDMIPIAEFQIRALAAGWAKLAQKNCAIGVTSP